jgi:hypothetical protein
MQRYTHRGFEIHHLCELAGRHKGQGKEFHAIHYNSSRLPFDLQMGPYRSREDTRNAIDRFLDGLGKFLAANNIKHSQPRYKKEVRRYVGLCMKMDSNITLKKSLGYADNYRYKDPLKLQREKGEITAAEAKKMIEAIKKDCAAHAKKAKKEAEKHQKKIEKQLAKDRARWKKEEAQRRKEKEEREAKALKRFQCACELTKKAQSDRRPMTKKELKAFVASLPDIPRKKKVNHANT